MDRLTGQQHQWCCSSCAARCVTTVSAVIDATAEPAAVRALVDGSLYQGRCNHCGAAAELDFPALVYFPERALPLYFVPAENTSNESDKADCQRLLELFKSQHADVWHDSWLTLFGVARRADFSHVAFRPHPAPATARTLLAPLMRLGAAADMAGLHGVLAEHPELLGDEASDLLTEIIDLHWIRRDEGAAADYEEDQALLASCREIGIDRTLAELDKEAPPELASLWDAADRAVEEYKRTRAARSIRACERAYAEILSHPAYRQAPGGFRWRMLRGYAYACHDRYEVEQRVEQLNDAIDHIEQALEIIPRLSRRERCAMLNSLATWRMDRHKRRGDPDDLHRAVSAWEEGYSIAPKADPISLQIVSNLGRALGDRFQLTRDVTDLDRSIDRLIEARDTALFFNRPQSLASTLNSLGIAYSRRFEQRGGPSDLDQAVDCLSKGFERSGDDPESLDRLAGNLARAYLIRYQRDGNLSDLELAIPLFQNRAARAPKDPADLGSCLNGLGEACLARYKRTRNRNDLDAALSAYERAVELTGQPHHIANLASGLVARYHLQNDLSDLRTALELFDRALGTKELSETLRTGIEAQAGPAYERAFSRMQDRTWIDRAIARYEEAFERTSPDAPGLPDALFALADTLSVRHQSFHDARDAARATRFFGHACQTGLVRDPQRALMAGRRWGEWSLGRQAWDEAELGYNYAAQAASRILRKQPDRPAKEVLVRTFQGLAEARASCLERLGRLQDAAAALEAGRCRLNEEAYGLGHMLLSRLVAQGDGVLAQRYRDLTREAGRLETEKAKLANEPARRQTIESLSATRDELRRIVAEIRQRPDLERDSSGARFADIAALTIGLDAPCIVYLTVLDDATLVLVIRKGTVRAHRLPLNTEAVRALLLVPKPQAALSTEETMALHEERLHYTDYGSAEALIAAYRPAAPTAFLPQDRPWSRERYLEVGAVKGGWLAALRGLVAFDAALDEVLPTLWSELMQPLAEQLLGEGTEQSLAALLIPCGDLALLPLHAAWEQSAGDQGVRRLVLSYAPAARALGAPRRAAPVVTDPTTSFLGVGNAQPVDAPLHFAEQEIVACAAALGAAEPDLVGDAATRDKTVPRLFEATFVHFACHGRFDPANPMESAVYLANGEPLTLGELIDLQLPRARLVVLTACETAISDTRFLPDEALGLANGFLHAGAQGVVSTLWPVNDVSTMLLMEQFYLGLVKQRLSPARALHAARLWLKTLRADDTRDRLAAILKTLDPDHRSAGKVSEQFRRFAEMKPDARPFSHPFHWAGFIFSGT